MHWVQEWESSVVQHCEQTSDAEVQCVGRESRATESLGVNSQVHPMALQLPPQPKLWCALL